MLIAVDHMTLVQAAVLHGLGLSAAAAGVLEPLLQTDNALPSEDSLHICLLLVDVHLSLQQLHKAAGFVHQTVF